jgi:membrane-bound lytic murein transglycosylase MltF
MRLNVTLVDRLRNPNRWFNNVERVTAEKIGRQTVEYVSNISRYYVAYKLAEERTPADTRS